MTWEILLEEDGENIKASHVLYGQVQDLGTKTDADILAKLDALSESKDSGVLPPVVRWVSPQRKYAILERPPQTLDVHYYGVKAGLVSKAKLQEHTIALPWTVYCVGFDAYMRPSETYVFASTGPIKDINHQLFVLPLTNTYANGRFCLPNLPEATLAMDKPWSMGEGLNASFGQVWMSNFNTDITDTCINSHRNRRPAIFYPDDPKINYAKIKPANILKRWSQLSIEEVVAIEDWPLPNGNNDYRLFQLMGDAMNWENTNYNSNVLYNSIRTMYF